MDIIRPTLGKGAPYVPVIERNGKMEKNDNDSTRILARSLARELTNEEIAIVSGGACSASTCSSSDNNSCDLDQCGDYNMN